MHPNRLIALAVSTAALAGVTAPGAVADHLRPVGTGATAGPAIPEPPTWPLHPQPVTQASATDDARVIPKPPTWPANPQPIPPPANAAQANIAGHAARFDWGSAGIGAGATLVALAVALVMAVVMRRGIARARL